MIKSFFTYIAVICLTCYCFFLYDDEIVGTMLAAEIIYLVITPPVLWNLKKKTEIRLEPMVSVAEKNQDIPVIVQVKNQSRWFPVHVRVRIMIENTFTGKKKKYVLRGSVMPGKKEFLKVFFREEQCGNIKVAMTRQSVYDLLCLLNSSKKVKQVQQVGILPECHLIPLEITRKTREFIADADEYSDRESGDDPSEIYQIREYREKDSIHDIHWKLSAKSDDILVKEHGRPLGEAVLIWLDLNEDELSGRKRKHKIKNVPVNMLELAASLSYSLSEEKCVHMVAWYEPENQQIRKKRISKEEHIYELLNRIMFVKLNQNIEEAKCRYEEAFRGEDFSTVVILKTDGTVSIGEETIMIPVENKEIVWDKLYFTL